MDGAYKDTQRRDELGTMNDKRQESFAEVTYPVIQRAAELMAQKIAEAMQPSLHLLDRRLDSLERILTSNGTEEFDHTDTIPQESDSKLCSQPGCNRASRARGLCSAHYQQLRYREKKTLIGNGDPAVLTNLCSVDGCERPVKARGLCSAHYQRLLYRERKHES